MTYKAQPIHEGGAVAHSMAAMCRAFQLSPEYVKLEVSFTDEGRCLYHLHGRASANFSFDERAATYEAVETKVVRALEQWRAHGIDGDATPEAAPDKLAVEVPQHSTIEQREGIIRLLNHPLITRQEKLNMLLNVNKLSQPLAEQAIQKLTKAIEDREGIRVAA